MFVDSRRCPECGSTNVINYSSPENLYTCDDCGTCEIEKYFHFTDAKYLPLYRGQGGERPMSCKIIN